jgi:predicted anti-sigma-YlaC factor YlaD
MDYEGGSMDCREVREHLVAYLDGELAPPFGRVVSSHLDGCPACREEARLLKESWALMDVLDDVQPSEDFEDRLWRKIDELAPEERPVARPIYRRWKVLSLLAAAMLLLAVGFFAFFRFFRDRGPGAGLEPMKESVAKADEEIQVANNLELLENMDLLENMEILQAYEILENIEDEDLQESG